jgi:hypothetical protein
MNNQKNRNIDDILSSLDGSQRASAPDFFYTRLKARMEKGLNKKEQRPWVLRPVYALAGFALLLIVNAVVILQKDNMNTENNMDTVSSQSIAAEYVLNENSIYDLTQE